MKKAVMIGAGVLALLALMVWVDKKFPAAERPPHNVSNAGGGESMPAISLKDLTDKEVALDQYQGQVVLVNFWATWCAPCRTEMPWMIEFQKKYSAQGFTILGVAMDDEGKSVVAPFIEKERFDVAGAQEPVNYPILLGNDDASSQFGGIIGLPTSMLYGRDGKKMRTIIGLVNHDEIAKAIEGLL